MQYKKISDFPNITTVGSGVYLPAVDPSESLAINQNKKIRVADFVDTYQGFTQSGTGAVSRTITSKLRDVVSVKDFGAVGDGVADDTAAIQASLTANFAVYFPQGTYRLNGSISLRTGNSLIGPGNSNANTDTNQNLGGAKLVFYGAGDACFKTTETAIGRLGFSGLTIMTNTVGRPWIFDLTGLNESKFYAINAANSDPAGGVLRATAGTGAPWINYFVNCSFGVPDASTQYNTDVEVTDTRIVGCYFTGGKGFHYHGYGGTVFSSCHFDRTNSAGAGLVLSKREPTHTPTQNTAITGCYFDENDSAGVKLDATGATVDTQWQVAVVGCAFRNRVTATDIKCIQPAGKLSFGGTFVGNSMTSGIPPFSFDATWGREVIGSTNVPGLDPFIYQDITVLPGFSSETGANPKIKFRNSGPIDGSPNLLEVGIDGTALNGVAYVNTSKSGVAADTPIELRINSTPLVKINANGNLDMLSGVFTFPTATTQTTVGATGAASALPANPAGYLKITINGVVKLLPYYNS